jgi:hypothetical protein
MSATLRIGQRNDCHRAEVEAILAGRFPTDYDIGAGCQRPIAVHLQTGEVGPTAARRLLGVDHTPAEFVMPQPDQTSALTCLACLTRRLTHPVKVSPRVRPSPAIARQKARRPAARWWADGITGGAGARYASAKRMRAPLRASTGHGRSGNAR